MFLIHSMYIHLLTQLIEVAEEGHMVHQEEEAA